MTSGSDDEEVDEFPVDGMVENLREKADETKSLCKGYTGKERICCNGFQNCLTWFQQSLSTVRIQAIGNQNMHNACRKLSVDLHITGGCVMSWTSQCHTTVSTTELSEPFVATLEELSVLRGELCNNFEPEQPDRPNTTSHLTTLAATTPPQSSNTTDRATFSTEHNINTAGNHSDRPGTVAPDSSTDDNIIIVSAVIGGLLLLCVIVVFLFIKHKRKQTSKNTESGGSLEPRIKPTLFMRLFHSPKNTDPVHTDTEIYAEIDDVFMEAVYRCDEEKPRPAGRDRILSSTHVNACYESTLSEDDIIANCSVTSNTNSIERNLIPTQPLSPLALIRKYDDDITSFKIDQSIDQKSQDTLTNQIGSSQRRFVTSRPGFTDIRSDSSSSEYIYIKTEWNNVFEDEAIYAVPSFEESEYDTAEYGPNPEKTICQARENDNSAFHEYGNVQNVPVHNDKRVVEAQCVKEYRRSSSDIDNVFVENHDTMMEY